MSTFSEGMFVQVRCMHVSIPIVLWQVLTISAVRSDVRPPAFLWYESQGFKQEGKSNYGAPRNVDELWSQCSHALDAIKEVLKTLREKVRNEGRRGF